MKKILSLTLAVMLLVSAIPTAFAADQDYSLGTAVTVEGAGGEYTVTVPATLSVGDVGTVTAKGYWASDETLKVTAPETIEVTNTETNQVTTVNVSFDGIKSLGDDLNEKNIPVDISIDAGNTKFGTWTGTIVYNVELAEPITFTITAWDSEAGEYGEAVTYQAVEGMTWAEWVNSEYNTGVLSTDTSTQFVQGANGEVFRNKESSAILWSDEVTSCNHNLV
ncbi:MAG: hypothetical protein IJ419_12735 [Agathobacter sp.]|nr:hypothetical protein [Agathobacter sp.]